MKFGHMLSAVTLGGFVAYLVFATVDTKLGLSFGLSNKLLGQPTPMI